MAGNGTGMWGVMHHDATSRAGVLREGAVAAADPLAALETLAARMPAARGGGVRAAAGRPVLRQRTEAGGGGGGGSQDPAGLLPQIGRRSNNAQVTPKAVAQGGGSRIVRPGLFPPDPMPMLGGGGLGGGGLGGGGGGDSDARVRGLERQCKDLREEQRQLAAWLSKTQEQLGSEAAARQQLEAQLLRLEQHVGVSNSELSARVGQTERQSVKLQDALSWSQNTMQDAVTKVANDVGALNLELHSASSATKVQQETLAQVTDELGGLERVSRTVASLQERSDYFGRTLDARLADAEGKAMAAAAAAESRADQALKSASDATKGSRALESHVQRQTEQLSESLRRLETTLTTQLGEQITVRGREVADALVREAEARLQRELVESTEATAQSTTSSLRAELDEQRTKLAVALRGAQDEQRAADEKMKTELRSILGQQKERIQQGHDESNKRFHGLEEALRADGAAVRSLEAALQEAQGKLLAAEERGAQLHSEVLAVEESLEAGLADLRNELTGQMGSLAVAEEARGRERGDEMRRAHTELSTQIATLRQRETNAFETSQKMEQLAEATHSTVERQQALSDWSLGVVEEMQQLRRLVTQLEEARHSDGGVRGGQQPSSSSLSSSISPRPIGRFGRAGLDPEQAAAASAKGLLPVESNEQERGDSGWQDREYGDNHAAAAARIQARQRGRTVRGHGRGEVRESAADDGAGNDVQARLDEHAHRFVDVDANFDMLQDILQQAAGERSASAETLSAMGETADVMMQRILFLEEAMSPIVAASEARSPDDASSTSLAPVSTPMSESPADTTQGNGKPSVPTGAEAGGTSDADTAATTIQAKQRGRAVRQAARQGLLAAAPPPPVGEEEQHAREEGGQQQQQQEQTELTETEESN